MEKKLVVKDFKGIEFQSVKKMCDYYNINMQTYYYRIKVGYTKEEALLKDKEFFRNTAKNKYTVHKEVVKNINDRTDHLGNIYESKTAMCEYYNLSRSLYSFRISKGMSKEEALTTPTTRKILPKEKRMINGKIYSSIKEINKTFFNDVKVSDRKLYDYFMTSKDINEVIYKVKIRDFNKKKAKLLDDLLKKYGVTKGAYYARRARGAGIKEAITVPLIMDIKQEKRTVNGKVYTTQGEMCAAYGITTGAYAQRISRGMDVDTALNVPLYSESSLAEKKIKGILHKRQNKGLLKFESQIIYSDCRDKSTLRFDFSVNVNGKIGLIEFDGRQHFVPNCFWSSIEELNKHGYNSFEDAKIGEFLQIIKHDKIKNEYCQKNCIPLLRIAYFQASKIEEILDLFFDNMDEYIIRLNPLIDNEEYYRERDSNYKKLLKENTDIQPANIL